MLARVPEFAVRGDQLAFLQHCHVVRRVLEIGKWLALGHTAPAPASLHPPLGTPTPAPAVTGGYVPVTVGGTTYQIYHDKRPAAAATCCACTPPARTDGSSTA